MNKSLKIFGVVVSALVIFLLIASVPAKAFTLNFDVKNNNVEKGQVVLFDVSIDVNSNENLSLSKLVLELNGSTNHICEFSVDGIILSGCNGMKITPVFDYINTSNYGYGYGYGYGTKLQKLSYKIALDTKDYELGSYNTKIRAYVGNEVFSQTGDKVSIGSSSSTDYENDGFIKVAEKCPVQGAFTCSEWSSCTKGVQTRTCQAAGNCYYTSAPAEERICVEDIVYVGALKLSSPYSSLRVGDNIVGEEDIVKKTSGINPLLVMFLLIVLIIVLLVFILVLVLTRNFNKKQKAKNNKKINQIMFKPQK